MNSKRKGNAGELEFLHLLEAQGLTAWRNDQRYTGGQDNPDVRLIAGGKTFHCEVKRTERLTLYPFMEQAQRDANGARCRWWPTGRTASRGSCVCRWRGFFPWLKKTAPRLDAELKRC